MKAFLILLSVLFVVSTHSMAGVEKKVYGYIEKVRVSDAGILLTAKLDTGAKSASLDATDIREVEEDGIPYLLFRVLDGNGGSVELKQKYIGNVRIKMRTEKSKSNKKRLAERLVVMMPIQVGEEKRDIRVNLTNREHFLYPLLLGREAIEAFDGIVDPKLAFTIDVGQIISAPEQRKIEAG
ncbi:putative ATP-dependent zinc protease [Candidatus Berkiella cookevillensis]|nr:RimK/LysX family protein [Candidatus Berkiella cookevillensis]